MTNDTDLGNAESASFRFSTETLPAADRLGVFREVFGQKMLRLDMEPFSSQGFRTDATVRSLPGLNVVWGSNSPVRVSRTRQLLSDGNDDLLLQWADAAGSCLHLGREIALGPGDAIALSCSDVGRVTFASSVNLISVGVPRAVFGSLLRDAGGCLARPISAHSAPLQMLIGYLELLRGGPALALPEMQKLAVAHVYDLLAVVLGATRDAAQTAGRRGVRAARLCAVKQEIARRSSDGALSVSDVAARFRLTPRYLQMLFESEGTTFTEFVREQRLTRAYRMLASGWIGHGKIADIALACGFGDISYFNRKFRARYGTTPSDVRDRSRD
ncbi:MAG TPA: AraC family transcriptional regulator [Rhizomicrobium sp.]|nr:AraC family transcriptional regulator [Rhizomicrobium sp.]